MAPPDLVVEGPVLVHKGCVGEQVLGKGRLHPPYGFPVGRAEVDPECQANQKDQVLCKDVGECPCHIGMVFDLAEV